MNSSILFNADGETAVQIVTTTLTRQGYQVIRSFDLRSALAAQPDYVCPCHRTTPCTCQFVVLLVYADAIGPAVIIVHGHDTEASLRLVDDPMIRPDPDLAAQVMVALVEAALSRPIATPPFTQVRADG